MTRPAALGRIAAFFGAVGASATPYTASATEASWNLTEAQWKTRLTPAAFAVLRQHATEPPGSSPLDHEKRKGTYYCAGCELALFASKTKFESGTGWPSFYEPLPHAVATSSDHSYFMERTEVHCIRCGGHLGHLFDDGPKPTGLRYCINGLALNFKPES